MHREIAEELVQVHVEVFEWLKIEFLEGLREFARLARQDVRLYSSVSNRQEFIDALVRMPDPTPAGKEAFAEIIRLKRYRLRRIYEGQTPRFKGRPRVISPFESKAVCAAILELLAEGVRVGDALGRVAQRLGISKRTLQRVWQGRADPNSPFYQGPST